MREGVIWCRPSAAAGNDDASSGSSERPASELSQLSCTAEVGIISKEESQQDAILTVSMPKHVFGSVRSTMSDMWQLRIEQHMGTNKLLSVTVPAPHRPGVEMF